MGYSSYMVPSPLLLTLSFDVHPKLPRVLENIFHSSLGNFFAYTKRNLNTSTKEYKDENRKRIKNLLKSAERQARKPQKPRLRSFKHENPQEFENFLNTTEYRKLRNWLRLNSNVRKLPTEALDRYERELKRDIKARQNKQAEANQYWRWMWERYIALFAWILRFFFPKRLLCFYAQFLTWGGVNHGDLYMYWSKDQVIEIILNCHPFSQIFLNPLLVGLSLFWMSFFCKGWKYLISPHLFKEGRHRASGYYLRDPRWWSSWMVGKGMGLFTTRNPADLVPTSSFGRLFDLILNFINSRADSHKKKK